MAVVDEFRLDGRVSIVTGCSSGLGIALATGLGRAGSDLVVCARREEKLRANAQTISRTTGRAVLPIVVDVTKEEDVNHLVAETMRQFGRLDVLVNNAGVSLAKPAENLSSEEWQSVNR